MKSSHTILRRNISITHWIRSNNYHSITRNTMASQTYDCPQCGLPSSDFAEGVCCHCLEINQAELDEHNAQFDHWSGMSVAERDAAIKFELR